MKGKIKTVSGAQVFAGERQLVILNDIGVKTSSSGSHASDE